MFNKNFRVVLFKPFDKKVKEYAKDLAGKYSKQLADFLDIDEEKAGSIFDENFIEEHQEDF